MALLYNVIQCVISSVQCYTMCFGFEQCVLQCYFKVTALRE